MNSKDWPRVIVHADMDAFYASVEQLDDPHLVGQPLIIGPRSRRGVVLTASYEARKSGAKSAMPMAEALRRCPHAVVVPPRFERYQQQSEAIMRAFADFSPSVEALSLDEAFIDMTGALEIFGDPMQIGKQIQQAVLDATGGLQVSVGIASTKYVAKVASDFEKPNGLTIVPPHKAVQWLDPMPVSRLWGAGPKTVPRLQRLGLHTIGDVRRASPLFLRKSLGNMGAHFQSLANANDPRKVARRRVARSMGSDRTLLQDVTSTADIAHYLRRSADRIGRRLRDKGYRCFGVRVKLKTHDFRVMTRQVLLPAPTDSSDELYAVAFDILQQLRTPSEPSLKFRLVGLAAYDLVHEDDPVQLDFFSGDEFSGRDRSRSLEQALDEVTQRFGAGAVARAADLNRSSTVADTTPNLDFVADGLAMEVDPQHDPEHDPEHDYAHGQDYVPNEQEPSLPESDEFLDDWCFDTGSD